jgi:hypothetical protein
MSNTTRASRTAKFGIYGAILLFAVILLFLSTKIDPNEPVVKELSTKLAIGLIIAILMNIPISHLNRLFDEHAAETRSASEAAALLQEFGVIDVVPNWNDFKAPTGVGQKFREHLEHLRGVWYIVAINPEGLAGEFFKEVILSAVRDGAKLRWAYVRLPGKEEGDAGKTLRAWWSSQYTAARHSTEAEALNSAMSNLSHNLGEIKRIALEEIAGNTIQPDSSEIYESLVPTTYLALLATRRQEDSRTVGAQIKRVWLKTVGIWILTLPSVVFG